MGAIALFDFGSWAARYPDLADTVSPDLAAAYFAEAGLYLANDGAGPIDDVVRQSLILNMLTAHIAILGSAGRGGASGMVGRVASATEGSVSVSTDMPTLPGSAAWFAQTAPGLSAWQAMAPYRMFRYIPPPRGNLGYGGRW